MIIEVVLSLTVVFASREGGANPSCGWIAMDMGNIALHLFDQVFVEGTGASMASRLPDPLRLTWQFKITRMT